jgi:hypothetical protein
MPRDLADPAEDPLNIVARIRVTGMKSTVAPIGSGVISTPTPLVRQRIHWWVGRQAEFTLFAPCQAIREGYRALNHRAVNRVTGIFFAVFF